VCRARDHQGPGRYSEVFRAHAILAQGSCSDDVLWNWIIKPLVSQGRAPDISLCLFACYGSPGTGVETDLVTTELPYTPPKIRKKESHRKRSHSETMPTHSDPASTKRGQSHAMVIRSPAVGDRELYALPQPTKATHPSAAPRYARRLSGSTALVVTGSST
jgi:hypothetical protein